MADSVQIDASEVHAFAAELGRVAGKALPGLDAVLKKGAQQIKDDLVADAKGSRHFKQIAPTISYDREAGIGRIGYEIGPDKDRGGAAKLANIAYFGGARGGGGTLDLDGPLRAEEPRLMSALDDYLGGLL